MFALVFFTLSVTVTTILSGKIYNPILLTEVTEDDFCWYLLIKSIMSNINTGRWFGCLLGVQII